MGIAAQTLHLQIAVSGIEGITQSRRGLGWPLKGLRRTNGRAIDRFSDLVPMARASPGRAWSASREADFPIYCPHVLMLFTGEPTVSCGCSSGRAPISISHCPMMERSIRFRWGTGLRGRDQSLDQPRRGFHSGSNSFGSRGGSSSLDGLHFGHGIPAPPHWQACGLHLSPAPTWHASKHFQSFRQSMKLGRDAACKTALKSNRR
jgi:hypothetical protein